MRFLLNYICVITSNLCDLKIVNLVSASGSRKKTQKINSRKLQLIMPHLLSYPQTF